MSVKQSELRAPAVESPVAVRRFPYPFRSMLAISSDTDRTTITRFRNIHRFLNTLEDTPIGPGVGLDIADSLWVFSNEMTTLAEPRDLALNVGNGPSRPHPQADEFAFYARAGWVDTLHTYGNYSTSTAESQFERRQAEIALAELEARDLFFAVWVNHGSRTNTQNFGNPRASEMQGDHPGSRSYHTDLLLDYGVRFAWNHLHGTTPGLESPLAPMRLRDGQSLWGFARFTAIRGPEATDVIHRHADFFARNPSLSARLATAVGEQTTMIWWPGLLDAQFTDARLDELVANSHFCVAAQHLGDLRDADWFPPEAAEAFRRIKRYEDEGLTLVARVSRLLEYARVSQYVRFDVRGPARQLYIDIDSVADPVLGTFVPTLDQIRGLTFYVPEPETTYLLLAGEPIRNAELVRSPSDGNGSSIGVRWFEPDTTDYVSQYEAANARRSAPRQDSSPPPGFNRLEPFGVEELDETAIAVDFGELGLAHPLRNKYAPTPRSVLQLILEDVPIEPDDVFLHLGSGKGRMLLVAACHPFRRVIGVEIAEPLNETARRNLEHNADRLACIDVEVVTAEPTDWPVPDDVTTVFFFDSFRGELFEQALANLVESLERRPRPLTFISLYPVEAQTIEATERFELVRTVQFGERPLEQIAYYESRPSGAGGGAHSFAEAARLLLASEDEVPEHLPAASFEEAVRYAVDRYSRPLEEHEAVLEQLGFVERERALDVGSGSGQWSIALSRRNREVVAVEARPEFVEVARRMAAYVGANNVSFTVARAETAEIDPGFDLAWCHSVLMYTNHELVLGNVARWTAPGGAFYCGYSSEGARLQRLVEGLAAGDQRAVERELSTLLSNERWRAGLGQRRGMLGLREDELVRMCALLGLKAVESPGVQSGPLSFLGMPATFDMVCTRAPAESVAPDGSSLVEAGLPLTALAAAGENEIEIRLRAQLGLGRPIEDDPLLEEIDEDARPLLLGMSQHIQGNHAAAHELYRAAPGDAPHRLALMVLCLLELERYGEALELTAQLPPSADDARAFAFRTAATLGLGGLDAARPVAAEFVEHRLAAGIAPAGEAERILESLTSSPA